MDRTQTFWNGRREADSDALQARMASILSSYVPAAFEIPGPSNRALEDYRRFANGYYDMFNNGGNWSVRGIGNLFMGVARKHGVKLLKTEMRSWISGHGYHAEMERLGDIVIDAALAEQGIEKA